MAETSPEVAFDPTSLGYEEVSDFDPKSLGYEEVGTFDPSALGYEEVSQESAPIQASNLSSLALSGAAEGGLQVASGAVRAFQFLQPQISALFDTVAKDTGLATTSEFITELEGAQARAEDEYGVDPKQKGFLPTLAKGAGSLLPTLASGPAAPYTTALMMGEQGFQEAEQAGATGPQKAVSALGNAAVGFVTEKLLGLPALLKSAKAAKLPEKTLKALIGSVTKQVGKSFLREGAQEELEQVSQDTIAKYIAAYDPERKIFDKTKFITTFLAGGILGGALGGVTQLAVDASPQEIAPKEEMQDAAQAIDTELANIAAATPESQFLSTAINTPEGIVTGKEQGTAHPEMILSAMEKGLSDEDVQKNLGFAFQTPEGTEWVDRVEAGKRLTESGQLAGLKEGEPLTSEHIRNEVPGVTFNPEPQTQNAVQERPSEDVLRNVPEQPEGLKSEVPAEEGTQRVSRGALQEQAKPSQTEAQVNEAATKLDKFRTEALSVAEQAGATDADIAVSEAQLQISQKGSSDKALFLDTVRKQALKQLERETAKKRGGKLEPSQIEEETVAETRGPRAESVSMEDVSSIEEAITRLPESQSKVMRALVENPGVSDLELSEITGLSVDAAKQAKSRARNTLREFIRKQGIGERMAPGASNIKELQKARYTLASDIYEGLRQTKELDRATWEKNMEREYGDIMSPEEINDAWYIAQAASEEYNQKGQRKPFPAIIEQMLGGQKGEGTTSIKNKVEDQERRSRGLPAAMQAARRSHVSVWDDAMRQMQENPQSQSELVSRLKENPRATVNDLELTMLLHKKIETENRYEAALESVNKSQTDQARLDAMSRAKEIQSELIDIYDLAKQVGSEQGRAFAARKMLVTRDYSVTRMASELQAAKGDKLTTEESQKVAEISDNIQRTESELDARVSTLEEQQSEKVFRETVKDFQERLPFDQRILAIANRIVAKLDAAAQKARERIRARLKNTNMGADPTLIYDLAVIGASKIARGLRDVAWKNSMREEFGEEVNPLLDQVYKESDAMIDRIEEELPNDVKSKVRQVVRKEGSEDIVNSTQEQLKTRSNEGESLRDMRGLIQKMALSLVRSGVTDPDALLDSMHAILTQIEPGLTRRQTMDLVSGYGDMKALDMEKAKVQLRDLKGQYQNLAKLEDIQTKGKIEKTGIERRKPSDAERRLIAQVNEAKKEFGVGTLDAYKTRLQHSISDLEDRIKRKDFGKRLPKPLDVSKDPEAVRLAAENARWKKEFAKEKLKAERSQESKWKKSIRVGKEVLNVPRAVKSSLDFSAVLRQGGFIALGNPVRAARNLGEMFKSFGIPTFKGQEAGKRAYERSEAEIRSRPNSDLYRRSKLYLADTEGDLSNREEAFRSELSDKLPLIQASNRAYVTFLNRLRADSFDAIVGNLPFTPDEKQLKAIAHYINVSTGRGDLGVHGSAAETLSTVLWSPRLLISRIQLLAAEPILRGDAKGVRTVIAKEYAKALAGSAIVIALGILAGAEVEKDPKSSDAGKLRFGDTRVDPWMGLQQVAVLANRLATREATTQEGRTYSLNKNSGDRRYNDPTTSDVIFRFARSKMTPLLGTFFDVEEGESVVGEKVTPLTATRDLVVPLSLNDVLPLMEEQGIPRGMALQVLNLFGMSVQQYSKENK